MKANQTASGSDIVEPEQQLTKSQKLLKGTKLTFAAGKDVNTEKGRVHQHIAYADQTRRGSKLRHSGYSDDELGAEEPQKSQQSDLQQTAQSQPRRLSFVKGNDSGKQDKGNLN